jgi:hypothetical protein
MERKEHRNKIDIALKEIFIPFLREKGFKGSLPHFRRQKEDRVSGLLFRQFVNIVFSCELCICLPKRNRALLRSNLTGIGGPTKYSFQEHCILRCFFLNYISEALCLKKPYAASYSAGVLKFSAS